MASSSRTPLHRAQALCRTDGSDEEAHDWSWPRTLNKDPTFDLTRSGFRVPQKMRLFGGSKISAHRYLIPPMPIGKDLAMRIKHAAKIY
jgi:hypothetical protein